MHKTGRLSLFALCGLIVVALASMNAWHIRELAEVETKLDSGNWESVEEKMNNLRARAFCHNLGGWNEVYLTEVALHDSISKIYNSAISRDQSNARLIEPKIEKGPVSVEAINGLIFVAHINPWQDCVQRYGIYRKY